MSAIPAADSLPVTRPPGPPPTPSLVFAYGFRVFFLCAGVFAIALMVLWLMQLLQPDVMSLPMPASQWHGHALLFGLVPAVIAGFLLTAVPNWTGTQRLHGTPLVWLAGLWLVGRLALLPGWCLPALPAAVLDLLFLPALTVAITPVLWRTPAPRNWGFPFLLLALTGANLLVHLGWLGLVSGGAALGLRLGVDIVVLLVAVVGGRITPAFTQNFLRQSGQPWEVRPWVWLDRASVLVLLVMVAVDAVAPDSRIGGAVTLVAALLHGVRLSRWRGRQILDTPILWILHLAYGWLVLALLLKGLWPLTGLAFAAGWLHALTVGAIGTVVLGVITRVGLGHTGRPLTVVPAITVSYALFTIAAVARVFGPVLLGGRLTLPSLHLAAGLWIVTFAIFLWVYAPILTRPRPDGRPG